MTLFPQYIEYQNIEQKDNFMSTQDILRTWEWKSNIYKRVRSKNLHRWHTDQYLNDVLRVFICKNGTKQDNFLSLRVPYEEKRQKRKK